MYAAALIWAILIALPASIWFEPGQPSFTDVVEGEDPQLIYSRNIKFRSEISFDAVVRRVGVTQPYCNGSNGFEYEKTQGAEEVVGKTLIAWWMGRQHTCHRGLEPGDYWVRTTWKIERPMEAFLPSWLDDSLGWILPPKRITMDSPPFHVTEKPQNAKVVP